MNIANNQIKKKYTFADVFVFLRTEKGFICISDAELSSFDTLQKHKFYSDSDYLLGLWSNSQFLISETTTDELMLLANISSKSHFYEQLTAFIPSKSASDVCAYICAKRIKKKTECYLELDENNNGAIYLFRKFQRKNDLRLHPVILSKSFKWGVYKR